MQLSNMQSEFGRYIKTGKLTKANLKKAGLKEFYDIAGDVVTVFSGDATALEKVGAVADLIIGTDFNNKGQKKNTKGFRIYI